VNDTLTYLEIYCKFNRLHTMSTSRGSVLQCMRVRTLIV
jgi:hypothetical protein